MKNYAKVGNRPGKPAFRTPSGFRVRKVMHGKKLTPKAFESKAFRREKSHFLKTHRAALKTAGDS